jgi:histidyl-tRNA synthetase
MKASLPAGFRDFGGADIRKRNFIIDTIKQTFEAFGFEPLETPVLENLSTLTGKYGEEGDRLLFKVLNQGEFTKDIPADVWESRDTRKLTPMLADRGMRFDLTVPLARYVVMNRNDIPLPYKRYQIQPVWRGDRPQRGRYREFYQCDADVIGSESLLNEVELLQIYSTVFAKLGLSKTELRINNRKILLALATVANAPDKMTDITVAIDKLDKIGIDKVMEELGGRGLNEAQCAIIKSFISIQGTNEEKLLALESLLGGHESAQKGLEELKELLGYCQQLKVQVILDTTLARGLNYYTGTIVEAVTNEVKIGSIGGGGRYDDLTGIFGMPGISGVGVSFGLERIFDVMEELKLFPEDINQTLKLIFLHFDEASMQYALMQLQEVRAAGINAMLYPGKAKMDKQMKYANARAIPFVCLVGENERNSGLLSLKDMRSGTQQTLSTSDIIKHLQS